MSSTKPPDPRTTAAQVRAYLEALPAPARRGCRAIRAAIRRAAPAATETFSYGIPGFRLDGRALLWYAGWKAHLSLYPVTKAVKAALAPALRGFDLAKGTIRFPLDDQVPAPLVQRITRVRVAEVRAANQVRRTGR